MRFFWGMVTGVVLALAFDGLYSLGKRVGKTQAMEEAYDGKSAR